MGFVQVPGLWMSDNRNYRVHMGRDTTVVAACEDAGCDQWRRGWETACDEADEMGGRVAMLIRSGQTGRDFREFPPSPGGTVTVFRFAPRQRCFREHRTRPGRLVVQRRGRTLREHASLAGLAEDYTEHVGRLAEQEKRG